MARKNRSGNSAAAGAASGDAAAAGDASKKFLWIFDGNLARMATGKKALVFMLCELAVSNSCLTKRFYASLMVSPCQAVYTY